MIMTQQFNLPPGLLNAVCYTESHYDIRAIHKDDGHGDSLGICQVKLETAQWLGYKGNAKQLMIPRLNMYYSAKYLRYQLDRYNQNIPQALIAYNMGNSKHLTHSKYSDKVLKEWQTIKSEQFPKINH
jgi:soluble lytic murein transglycosylase-like protein